MSTDGDQELGAALRSLPAPEHGPGFWEELDQRLAGEVPMEAAPSGRPRRFRPGGTWLLAAAAAVAMVVAAVAVLDDGPGTNVKVGPPATTPTPSAEPWTTLSDAPLSPRRGHAAVWTGSRMVVWGGDGTDGLPLDDGAVYDPATDRWTPMASSPTGPLFGVKGVWTGTRVLLWGTAEGDGPDPAGAGALYDPASDSWTEISPMPLRSGDQSIVWTGEALLVWGGSIGELPVADGAFYDPESDTWTTMAPAPIAARYGHTVVWAGDRMLVWGGFSGEESPSREAFADGAAYDPGDDAWTDLPPAPIGGRAGHAAVWTGTSMVVWGGSTNNAGLVADGAAYDPGAGSWSVLPASPLSPRMSPSVIAAGGSMLVWGGENETGAVADGAVYDVATGTWRALPDGPVTPRSRHSAVWTGSSMIVWGGAAGQDLRSDGAALRPPPAGAPAQVTPATQVTFAPRIPPTACEDVGFTPDSDDVASEIVAEGIPCREAEAFVRRVGGPLGPVNGLARVEQDGFVCIRTEQGDDGLPTSAYECTGPTGRITFNRT